MLSNSCHRSIAATIKRGFAGTASVVLLLTIPVSFAGASPILDQPTPSAPSSCPLMRVGTQFVRCDNLTGAGVSAPPWIPELPSGKATHKLDPC
jgi:hypothetical protein